MSDKGFFKETMLEKWSNFQMLKKLLILIASTNIQERFTVDVKDWSIRDWPIQKISFANINMERSHARSLELLRAREVSIN